MTTQGTNQLNKIIFGIASALVIFVFGFIFNKIEAQSKDLEKCKIDIAVTQEQNRSINAKLDDILLSIKDTNRMLNKHMER
jgi:hypothetical protein